MRSLHLRSFRVRVQAFFQPAARGTAPARRMLWLTPALLLASTAGLARAQNYASIVVFGDSLCDTGNVGHLTESAYGVEIPGPIADYTAGRFTDGFDTSPAAEAYQGVWVEQLAAALPNRPVVKNSLNGGTNYAYGDATNASSSSLVTLAAPPVAPFTIAVTVNNIGLQITNYLATHPTINSKTLFVVWGGANDVLGATTPQQVIDAAVTDATNVQRLIDAGATQIIVPNLPPLGATPALLGTSEAPITTLGAELYNVTLSAALDLIDAFNFFRGVKLYRLDVYTLYNKIASNPGSYDLANVTAPAQGNLAVNPDTYLFWDDLHPTTHGHDILALAAAELLAPNKCWRDNWPYVLPEANVPCPI